MKVFFLSNCRFAKPATKVISDVFSLHFIFIFPVLYQSEEKDLPLSKTKKEDS